MTTTTETTTRTCPPSAVADQIVPWHEVREGDAVLFMGHLRQLVATWPAMLDSAPDVVGVRLLDGGDTQDFHVVSSHLTAVRRYTEGSDEDQALILAALDEAAEDRTERAGRFCSDCTETGDGPCADQREHLDRASEYRELRDRLEAGR